MNKLIRTIAILSLFALWLPSCGREPVLHSGETTAVTTAEPAVSLTLDAGYQIVRGEHAAKGVVEAASALRKALSAATGGTIKITDDWLAPGKTASAAEILVGATNRAEAAAMKKDDYRVFVEGGQLRIEGGSAAAISAAVDAFIEGWLGSTPKLDLPEGDLLVHTGDYAAADITIGGVSLRDCTIVLPLGWGAYLDEVWLREANRLASGLNALCGWQIDVKRGDGTGTGEIRFGHPDDSPVQWAVTAEGISAGSTTAVTRAVDELLKEAERQAKKTPDGFALDALGLSGDVSDILTIERTEGTELRVMNNNVLWLPPQNALLSTNARMAVIAEAFDHYAPDVFTLQEMEEGIKKILLPLLTATDDKYAIAPSDGWSVIVYNTDLLTLIESGYEYFEPYERSKGFAWAVFEMTDGRRFIVTSAHYVLNPKEDESQGPILRGLNSLQKLEKINALRQTYQCGAISGGDYFCSKGGPAYENMMQGGFIDPAETATVKKMANVETHHTLGEPNETGKGIDLILCTPDFAPLTHRIMVRNPYLMHATDHTPEYVDFAFAK